MECVSCDVLVGCNRVVGALSWGDGLIAFGASNVVILYEPEVKSLTQALASTQHFVQRDFGVLCVN